MIAFSANSCYSLAILCQLKPLFISQWRARVSRITSHVDDLYHLWSMHASFHFTSLASGSPLQHLVRPFEKPLQKNTALKRDKEIGKEIGKKTRQLLTVCGPPFSEQIRRRGSLSLSVISRVKPEPEIHSQNCAHKQAVTPNSQRPRGLRPDSPQIYSAIKIDDSDQGHKLINERYFWRSKIGRDKQTSDRTRTKCR